MTRRKATRRKTTAPAEVTATDAKNAIRDAPPDLEVVTTALNRWYYSEIRDLADAVVARCNADGIPWSDGINTDIIHEIVDGAEIIIYTYQAQLACVATDQPDRPCTDGGCDHSKIEQCAYYAVRADVWEELQRRDGAGFTATQEGV